MSYIRPITINDVSECLLTKTWGEGCCDVIIFAVAPSAHKKAKMNNIALHYMLLNNKGICSLDNKVIKECRHCTL